MYDILKFMLVPTSGDGKSRFVSECSDRNAEEAGKV